MTKPTRRPAGPRSGDASRYSLVIGLTSVLAFAAPLAHATRPVPGIPRGLVAASTSVAARLTNYRMCFSSGTPTIDGSIANDPGWGLHLWRYVFGNGTPSNNVVVQAATNSTNLFLSFEVNNDRQFNSTDVIEIGIDPGSGTNLRRLIIYPLTNSGLATGNIWSYWDSGPTWALGSGTGVLVAATTSGTNPVQPSDPPVSWFVEVQIPRATFGVPSTGDFGLYLNVVPTQGPTTGPYGTAREFPWPTEQSSRLGLDVENTPDAAYWGTASLSGTCNGVSAVSLTTNQQDPSEIALTGENEFQVAVSNTTKNAAGTLIPAQGVKADVRFATFGIPSSWTSLPWSGAFSNPSQPTTVSAGASSEIIKTTWTLNQNQKNMYGGNSYCIAAVLDAEPPAGQVTPIVNRAVYKNMHFATGSKVEHKAEVSSRGYKKPTDGSTNQRFQLFATTSVDTIGGVLGEASGRGAAERGKKKSYLLYLVHGCRLTGDLITIRGQQFSRCEPTNSYGYYIKHASDKKVAKWISKLSGKGLSGSGNSYELTMPPDTAAGVDFETTPEEEGEVTPGPGGGGGGNCFNRLAGRAQLVTLVGGLGLLGLMGFRRRRDYEEGSEHRAEPMP